MAEPPPPYQENPSTATDGDGQTDTDNNNNNDAGGDAEKQEVAAGEGIFGEAKNRAFALGGILIFYCLLTIFWWAWNADTNGELHENACEGVDSDPCTRLAAQVAGYSFLTIAMFLIGIGAILAIVGALQGGNKCFGIIVLILEVVGTVFALLGYLCIVGAITDQYDYWNVDMEDSTTGGFTGYFGELGIVCGTALVLGIDSFKYGFFNDDKKRAMAMSGVLFVIFGFIAGVGYAIVAQYWDDYADEWSSWVSIPVPDAEYGCMAAGYFILAIVSVIRLVIAMGFVSTGVNPITNATVGMVLAILLIIGGLVCAAGYWGLVDFYDTDGIDVDGLDQQKCWYMGTSFFMLFLSIINGLDMGLIEKCKMAQQAGAAANAAT